MDPRFRTALWALAGLALAIGISLTAFAVAGGDISQPAGSVRVIPTADEQQPEHTPDPSKSTKPSSSDGPSAGPETSTSSATATFSSAVPSPSDDHGSAGTSDGNDD